MPALYIHCLRHKQTNITSHTPYSFMIKICRFVPAISTEQKCQRFEFNSCGLLFHVKTISTKTHDAIVWEKMMGSSSNDMDDYDRFSISDTKFPKIELVKNTSCYYCLCVKFTWD